MAERRKEPGRRFALTVLLLVGLPSVALAVIGFLYVSEAQTFVERRHRETARELTLDLAGKLGERLRAETGNLEAGAPSVSLPFRADAAGLRSPQASGPSPWEQAYAEAYDRLQPEWAAGDPRAVAPRHPEGSIERLASLMEARAKPAELLEEATKAAAPWSSEALLRIGLEAGQPMAEVWEKALPDLPLDLARDLLSRMEGVDAAPLRRSLAAREAELDACREAAGLKPGPDWTAGLLPGGGIALVRAGENGTRFGGVLLPSVLTRMLDEVAAKRPEALGLTLALGKDGREGQAVPGFEGLALSLSPVGPASRLGDLRSILYVWAVAILVALIGAGSWVVVRGVRREARQVSLKSDFVSSISHELKTPLTSIRMFVDTLLLGRVKGPEDTRECLGLIARETERLSRLIEQVLTLARLEGGARRFVFRPASPAALIDDACEALQAEAGAAGILFRRRTEAAPAEFPMDRGAMAEVLTNLLSNAVKYSGQGREVSIEARSGDGGLRLDVTDAGPGIPAAERERLFERFQRGSAASASGASGTGLGLAIVRALVQGQGGRVWMEAASPSGGSRFCVWIPASQSPQEEMAHA